MPRLVWTGVVWTGLVGAGCVGVSPDAAFDPFVEAQEVAILAFDAEGMTPELELSDNGSALLATGDKDICFRSLESNSDSDPNSDSDSNSGARGAALETPLSADEANATSLRTSVRFQRLRCETGTPLRQPLEGALSVSTVPLAGGDDGKILLRFVVSEHSPLRGDATLVEALVAALADELRPAGIFPELLSVVEVRGAPAESRFGDLHNGVLDELRDLAPAAESGAIDVVFAGCLRRLDPVGTPSAVLGFTGRVGGGGGGGADAVFLPSLRCEDLRAPAFDVPRSAHILAHELGHFLGLAHSAEGTDIMHTNPQLSTARGFTPAQGRRMRLHPFVQPM